MRQTSAPDNPANHAPSLLVVTDLDGTLLDHFNYGFEPAAEALARLRQLGIPLVPNTSKTLAELGPLRRALGIDDPFIVENGSALFLPRSRFSLPPGGTAFSKDYYLVELGLGYRQVLDRLAPLRDSFRFRGFNDLSAAELAQLTGLAPDALALARQRRFSEPLLWQDSEAALADFRQALDAAGLASLQGGRFLHVLGKTDKGLALTRLRRVYEQAHGRPFTVIALGDSGNDVAMLEAADWPVLIRSPSHGLPRLQTDQSVTVSHQCGPAGWNDCVLTLIDRFLSTERADRPTNNGRL